MLRALVSRSLLLLPPSILSQGMSHGILNPPADSTVFVLINYFPKNKVQQLPSFYIIDCYFQHWLASCQTGELYSLLKDHWRQYVLLAFRHPDDPAKEDRLATKFLFRPMEYFLCGEDPDEVFKQLKDKDQPSQLCGHVFKNGEPTYSCRYLH